MSVDDKHAESAESTPKPDGSDCPSDVGAAAVQPAEQEAGDPIAEAKIVESRFEETEAGRRRPTLKSVSAWLGLHAQALHVVSNVVVALAAVVGIYSVVNQGRQTQQAIAEAKESNRISREVLKNANASAVEQAKKDERQLKAMEGTAQAAASSASAANLSASASRTQADAVVAGNRINQGAADQSVLAFHQDQRARIVFMGIELVQEGSATQPFRARLQFQNLGKTQAVRLRVASFLNIGLTRARPDWSTCCRWSTPTALDPGTKGGSFDPSYQFGKEFVDLYADTKRPDRHHIFIQTRIEYCDTFGRKHWRVACHSRSADSDSFRLCEREESPEVGESCD